MRIISNIPSLHTTASINRAGRGVAVSMNRLSTGLRVASSRDNPAMHSIGNRIANQIDGTQGAAQSSMNGISMIQTAEGALNELQNMLQRQRELTVQALNATYSDHSRNIMFNELEQLNDGIDMLARSTQFNRINLLAQEGFRLSGEWLGDGTDKDQPDFRLPALLIQVGANMDQNMSITLADVRSQTLGLREIDFSDTASMTEALVIIDAAISQVSEIRSAFGAYQNRLQHVYQSLWAADENMQQSLSRIRDTDMAREMTEMARLRVIEQAGIAVLAQSNMRPQQLLQLIG